jgi:hypothetical protein
MGGNFSLLNNEAFPNDVTPQDNNVQYNNVTPQVTCGENTKLNEFTKQCVGAFDAESYCGTNTAASNGKCVGAFDAESYCGTNTAVSDEKCVADNTAICGAGTRYDESESRCMIDKYELGPGVKLDSQNVAQVDDNIFTPSVVWDPVNTAVTASSSAVSSFCNAERNAVYDVSSQMCVADTANLLAQKCSPAKGLQYNAVDDTCEYASTTTNSNEFCGTHTQLDESGKCVASSETCDSAAMTFDAATAKCVVSEGVCGTGTTLKNGECVPDGSVCSSNMTFDVSTGKCVLTECPQGTAMEDGQCKAVCTERENLVYHDGMKACILDQDRFESDTAKTMGRLGDGVKCHAKEGACSQGTEFDPDTNTCQVKADVCAKGSAFQNGRCVDALPNEIKARIRDGHQNSHRLDAGHIDNNAVAAYSVYCTTDAVGKVVCDRDNRYTAGDWHWKKVNKEAPLDEEYYLFAPDGKQCQVNTYDQKFYCEGNPGTSDNYIFKVNKVSKNQDPWNGQVGESIYMKSKATGKYCLMRDSECKTLAQMHERMGLEPKDKSNDSWFPNPFINAPLADNTTSAVGGYVKKGYQDLNHTFMGGADMAESIEECRDYARRRGAAVIGFRNEDHPDAAEKKTCFYFNKAEPIKHDSGGEIHTSMCTADYMLFPEQCEK